MSSVFPKVHGEQVSMSINPILFILLRVKWVLWMVLHCMSCRLVLVRVTRFEIVKKRTLCGTSPPTPWWSFWTSFSHADDPAPSPPHPSIFLLNLFLSVWTDHCWEVLSFQSCPSCSSARAVNLNTFLCLIFLSLSPRCSMPGARGEAPPSISMLSRSLTDRAVSVQIGDLWNVPTHEIPWPLITGYQPVKCVHSISLIVLSRCVGATWLSVLLLASPGSNRASACSQRWTTFSACSTYISAIMVINS